MKTLKEWFDDILKVREFSVMPTYTENAEETDRLLQKIAKVKKLVTVLKEKLGGGEVVTPVHLQEIEDELTDSQEPHSR